jgi:hypothetical protein
MASHVYTPSVIFALASENTDKYPIYTINLHSTPLAGANLTSHQNENKQ